MISLIGADPAWQELLRQVGVPFQVGRPDRSTRLLLVSGRVGTREAHTALADACPDCELLRLGRLPAPGRVRVRVFCDTTPHPVVERAGYHDRGELRRQAVRTMRQLLNRHSLPFPHLAYCPGSGRSAFAFRVDTDYCGIEELLAARRLADAAGVSFSWFINTEAHGLLMPELKLVFEGQDVQVHCHRHEVYRSQAANRRNLAAALGVLRSNGYRPAGAASPYGDWNPGWNAALAELKLGFSSDFVAGWDDLPFRPTIKGETSSVLQVPVHPVCLGRLRAARAADDEIRHYYRSVILRQKSLREPCLLYDHPTGLSRDYGLMAEVLREARRASDVALTVSSLASWWQTRELVRYLVTMRSGAIEVEVRSPDDDVEIELELEDRFARVPLKSGRYELERLNWQPLDDPGPRPMLIQRLSVRRWLGERYRRLRRQTGAKRRGGNSS